jgi:hypothetical protein
MNKYLKRQKIKCPYLDKKNGMKSCSLIFVCGSNCDEDYMVLESHEAYEERLIQMIHELAIMPQCEIGNEYTLYHCANFRATDWRMK